MKSINEILKKEGKVFFMLSHTSQKSFYYLQKKMVVNG